ncbi:MAG TPA: putative ABC exporter domain-containing protein, partial [Verrucomicrobiota bacterium]|nr:putative ABC exporter domain-containing protein [Verrucomicrobiota bacterium]
MFRTLVYLVACQWWNRVLSQVRRLRQPKYLAAAAAGLAYFYWFFLRNMFLGPPGVSPFRAAGAERGIEWAALWEVAGALGVAAMVVAAWLFPRKRAALDFSEAEVAFLFPAPVGRRTLVHYKVLRGQLGILLGAVLMMLMSARSTTGPVWVRLLGWWTLIAALELHRLGAAFARTRLLDRGMTTGRRRLWVLGTALVVAAGFFAWVWRAQVMPTAGDWASMESMAAYAGRVSDSGPLYWLLLPFRVMVRPLVAGSGGAFAAAIVPAWAVLGVLYGWVIRSTVAFEEASVERAALRARAQAAVRSGNWQLLEGLRPRRDPFRLAPLGLPEIGFLWKNLIVAGSTFSVRFWVSLGVGLVVAAMAMKGAMRGSAGPPMLGMLLLVSAVLSLVVGPQVATFDLRQSFGTLEVLKTLPVPGWRLVLGEVAASWVVLTVVQ